MFVPYPWPIMTIVDPPVDAWMAAGGMEYPTLVTTGTGSGKTECFLLPALDHCARQRDAGAHGIKALILYPMNALANSQLGELEKYLRLGYPDRIGRARTVRADGSGRGELLLANGRGGDGQGAPGSRFAGAARSGQRFRFWEWLIAGVQEKYPDAIFLAEAFTRPMRLA